MSAEEELRNDYINDLADTANLDPDQISISSVELLNSVTGQYKITSEIEFFDLDETAVQALVTKINDKSAFARLNEKHGTIESVPQVKRKEFSESDPKPKMIATKKKPDGTIVEKVETIRRKTGRVRERKFNPNDETDILETTEISAEDENGDKIRETFFKDQRRRRVRFKANNQSNVLETTEVSAPDETTGDVTTKVTQADGSYVETVKDSSDVVKNTTEASAPDETTGNVTITVTDNVTGQTTNEVVYSEGPLAVDRSIHFEDYTIDGTVIGNNGISVSEQTYTTTGVGKVGIDENGKKYLEMLNGQMQLPAYVDDPTAIAHTMYFVVRSTSFNDVNGYITKVATGTGSDNNFNLHVTQNTGFYPIVWPTNNNWVVAKDNSFSPRESYIIIMMKLKYKSQYTYDARIQFVSKPFDEIVYGGYTSEMTDLASSSREISTQINIGTNDWQTTNMHLYEYGLLNEYVNDTKFDNILQTIVNKYFPEPEPEVKAFEDLFGTGWTIVEYVPGDSSSWHKGSQLLEGYSGGEFLFTTGDNSRWLIADHDQIVGENYSNALRTVKRSSLNNSPHQIRFYNRGSSNPEDPLISLSDWGENAVVQKHLMFIGNGNTEPQVLDSLHSSGMYVYTRGGTVNKQYTYKFQVSVQHIHGLHNIIRHIMANGVDLGTWDKFVSIRAITAPNRQGPINGILIAGTEVAWNSSAVSAGRDIFEVVTSERVQYFDIEYRRPKYRSGWKIYENGILKLHETTNGGNGADSPTLYYPYMVNPEFGRVGRSLPPYKYTFEIGVQSESKSCAIDHVKINGQLIGETNGKIIALNSPNVNNTEIDNILLNDYTKLAEWNTTISTVGTPLFEIYTYEPITEFEIFYKDHASGPGWNIYENDTLKISQSLNLGSNVSHLTYGNGDGNVVPSKKYKVDGYVYKFEVNVESNYASSNQAIGIAFFYLKANDTHLSEWDGFVGIYGSPSRVRNGIQETIEGLMYGRPIEHDIPVNIVTDPAWDSPSSKAGNMIIELHTSVKVEKFALDTARPIYTPGWNIYENGSLLISETSNHGSSYNSPQGKAIHNSTGGQSSTYVNEFIIPNVYTFEVNVVNGSDNGNSFINQITMDGNQLDSWDQFVSVRGLHTNYHPSDPSKNIVENVLDAQMEPSWAILPASQGLEFIEIITLSKVNNIQITYGRPQQAPGLNIYENGVLKLSENANRGSDLNPTQVTYTYQLTYVPPPTLYKYVFEVSARSHYGEGRIELNEVQANGHVLGTWDKFISASVIYTNDDGNINNVTDGNTGKPTIKWDVSNGTKVFELVTSEKVTEFKTWYHRQKYTPGWKIYENDVVVLTEPSNGGSSDQSPYQRTHTLQ